MEHIRNWGLKSDEEEVEKLKAREEQRFGWNLSKAPKLALLK